MGEWKFDSTKDQWSYDVSDPDTASAYYRSVESFGGPGGHPFDDLPSLPRPPLITKISVKGDDRLRVLEYTLATGKSVTIGKNRTNAPTQSLDLQSDEKITQIEIYKTEIYTSVRVSYIEVKTSNARSISVGEKKGESTVFRAPNGYAGVSGFHGRSGDDVDSLGVIWGK